MAYGLDENGFTRKRLQDIRSDINEEFISVFGDVDVSDESVLGQIAGVLAEPLAELWELMELIYLSQAPASADGVQLDNVASYLGITRLAATATTANVACYTESPASVPITIPAGTQLSMSSTGSIFQNATAVTIDDGACVDAWFYVSDATTGDTFKVTINTESHDATASASDTTNSVANTLYQSLTGSSYVTPTDTSNGYVRVLSNNNETQFSIAVSSVGGAVALTDVGSLGSFACTVDGTVSAPANTINTIDTPVANLDYVNNLDAGTRGRAIETDAELRIRRAESLMLSGAGTVDSIRSAILNNVDDVSVCRVWENTADVTSSGIPPHSIYCVVSGGDTSAVAQQIWDKKPAGIRTHGSTSYTIYDSADNPHAVKFSRPDQKYAWVNIIYNVYSEEKYPGESSAVSSIKSSIKSWGDEFGIGEDIIRDRVYQPIYDAGVPGIGNISTLQVALMDDSTSVPGVGDWTSDDISVDLDQLVVWETNHMYVSEA